MKKLNSRVKSILMNLWHANRLSARLMVKLIIEAQLVVNQACNRLSALYKVSIKINVAMLMI
jgi:hypothetical protein